jgi:hypothetical protein
MRHWLVWRGKQTLAQPKRNGASAALPPLAFLFGGDFVCNRSEWQQGTHFDLMFLVRNAEF